MPNPSLSGTRIGFSMPEAGRVSITVYDVEGRLVEVVVDGSYPAGHHEVAWKAVGRKGASAPGIYLIRIETPGVRVTKKATLIR